MLGNLVVRLYGNATRRAVPARRMVMMEFPEVKDDCSVRNKRVVEFRGNCRVAG